MLPLLTSDVSSPDPSPGRPEAAARALASERGKAFEESPGESAGQSASAVQAQAYLDLGLSHYVQGRHRQAVKLFRKGLDLAPQSAYGHYLLGLAFRALGQVQAARTEWGRALRIEGAGEQAAWAQAMAKRLLGEDLPGRAGTTG